MWYGITFGKNIKALGGIPTIYVQPYCKGVSIGDNFSVHSFYNTGWNSRTCIKVMNGAELRIGNHSGMNGALIYCADKIVIGDHVNIGGGTRIYDTNFHNLDWKARRVFATNMIAKTAPVHIEDDVFIGAGCIIGKGVTIGARSVIAAGSVVVKSIPPDSIAGGNPCKVISSVQ